MKYLFISLARNFLRRLYSNIYKSQRIEYEYTGHYWETKQPYQGRVYNVYIKLYKYTLIPGGIISRKKIQYLFKIEFYDIEDAEVPVRYHVMVPMMTPLFLLITTIPFRIALTAALRDTLR